jgi:CRP/FNR family transcriptional regulator, dissimilatory nitrate respiration regulator
MDINSLIDQSRFFDGISREHKAALVRYCLRCERRKKETLFHEGDEGEAMFLLAHGRVRLHKTAADGREVVINVIKPGEVFAEVILFEEKSYPVTAVALTDVIALKLPRRNLLSLLQQEDFRNDFIAMLLRKQRFLAERIRLLSSESVEDRLRAFLREQYGEREQITVEINKKQMASAIGATPETLSRILQRLKRQKSLQWQAGVIKIADSFWNSGDVFPIMRR